MAAERRKRILTAFIISDLSRRAHLMVDFYDSTTVELLGFICANSRRHRIPKVENYYSDIIPQYNLDDFRSHFRLSRGTFEETVTRLENSMSSDVKPGPERNLEKSLLMFLWYIGNQECFRSMADRFDVSKSNFHGTVKFVSQTLVSHVMPDTIKWPSGDKVGQTARRFGEKSQFQGILGAIDGTHIEIKAPKEHKEVYYNRKKFPSVVLLAVCDADLQFTFVFTGWPGSAHDAGVLRHTDLFENAEHAIPDGYYVLGDSAFPLKRWLMTPFKDYGNLTRQQRLYNKELNQSRQNIERAFGLLKCRFRRLIRLDALDMELIVSSILSACVLHNICLLNDENYLDNDIPLCQDGNDNVLPVVGNELRGIQIRQQLMEQLLLNAQ